MIDLTYPYTCTQIYTQKIVISIHPWILKGLRQDNTEEAFRKAMTVGLPCLSSNQKGNAQFLDGSFTT